MSTSGASRVGPRLATAGRWALVLCAAGLLAALSALLIDGVRVVARGGTASTLVLLHGLAAPVGLALAGVCGGAAALGALVGCGLRRVGLAVPPSRWAFVAVALLAVEPLHVAHVTMVKHPLAAVLFSGYAAALFALVALFVDRHRPGLAQRPLRVAGLGLLAGLGVHTINATAYANLYDELHRALSAVTLLGWLLVWVLALHRWRTRRLVIVASGLLLTGGLAGLGGLALAVDRASLTVYGTESRHALELLSSYLDGDGDGLAAPPVGTDCDDDDPAVHPLRFEVAGNGVDDNCRLGDAPASKAAHPDPIRPALAPSPGAKAWRAAHPAPDVVLIFVDTLRADALGRGDSPNIDALAAASARFTAARSTVGRTPHAWMSVIRARFLERTLACRRTLRDPGPQTLVHRMRSAGWKTMARLVGKSWRKFHLDGGWDVLRMRGHVKRQTGAAVVDDVLRFSKANADRRVFLAAHFADPHVPHRTAEGERHAGPLAEGYRAEVRYTDAQVGRLLDGLAERARPTLVVLFADHGENLGERGQDGGHHGGSVFDEVVRVPLMVHGPGIPSGEIAAPVSIADIAPTVLDLTGQPRLPAADGRSLAGLIFGDGPAPGPVVSGFFDFGHRLRSIVDGRYKLIVDARRGSRLLFDVVADPGESINLTASQPGEVQRLQGLLDHWLEYEADRVGYGKGCKNLAVGR